MTSEQLLYLVLAVAGVATATAGLLSHRGHRAWAVATLALLVVPLTLAWVDGTAGPPDAGSHVVALGAGVLAVVGGGLVTKEVLTTVESGSVRSAGDVLRGGAWIGALERLAVFATLVAGWGPGLAIVLAVKGLGRYPELRNQEDTGAAERFIIGTFTSVLWAAGCAGLAALAT
jgi:hypothetical protein